MHIPFLLRLKYSLKAITGILRRPKYLAVILIGGFLTFQLLLWFYNSHTLFYMLFNSHLSLVSKLIFPFKSFTSLLTSFSSIQVSTMIILALVQGLLLALIIYIGYRRTLSSAGVMTGGGSLFIALFGFGCPTCGTSLLTPLLMTLASGSAASIGAVVGPIMNVLGIFLGLVALYQISMPLATEMAKEREHISGTNSK